MNIDYSSRMEGVDDFAQHNSIRHPLPRVVWQLHTNQLLNRLHTCERNSNRWQALSVNHEVSWQGLW